MISPRHEYGSQRRELGSPQRGLESSRGGRGSPRRLPGITPRQPLSQQSGSVESSTRRDMISSVLHKAHAGFVLDKRDVALAIRDYNDLLERKDPSPGTVAVSRKDYKDMQDTIKYQEAKLLEFSNRLTTLNSSLRHFAPIQPSSQTDSQDEGRLQELADRFNDIFDNEWSSALDEMGTVYRMSEEESMYILMRIIRYACAFCESLASEQIDRLVPVVRDQMLRPAGLRSLERHQAFQSPRSPPKKWHIYKQTKDFRKHVASLSVPAIQEAFSRDKIQKILDSQMLKGDIRRYMDKCVEVVWLMCVQEPPMWLYWQEQRQRVLPASFSYYSREGEYVKETVWPAVFSHEGGTLLSKGYVLTI